MTNVFQIRLPRIVTHTTAALAACLYSVSTATSVPFHDNQNLARFR